MEQLAEIINDQGDVWTFYEDGESSSGVLTHIFDSPSLPGHRAVLTISRQVLLQMAAALQPTRTSNAGENVVVFPSRRSA